MENRTEQGIRPVAYTAVGNLVAGAKLHSVLVELVTQVSLIDTAQLNQLLPQFGVIVKDTDLLNADLKAAESNYELVEFESTQLPGTQIAIIPHGQEHDPTTMLFIAEEAGRSDLYQLEE